jgi:DUF2911 family protein
MKNLIPALSLCALLMVACTEKKATEEKVAEQVQAPAAVSAEEGVVILKQTQEDTLKGSLKAYVKEKVGDAEIRITYHSPAVRGRIVWGGLVPFDRVWVTGAHMATTLECNLDFIFNNTNLPAGKYGLFTIPGKNTWTVIINKNWQQHLTDEYDSKDDVARMEIIPNQLTENQERLQYAIEALTESECVIHIAWEKLQLNIPITISSPKK